MRTAALSRWTLAFLSLAGCAQPTRDQSATLSEFDPAAVEAEVTQTIRDFFAGFSKATCADGRAVSRFASDSSVYVDDTELIVVSLADYEAGIRERACKWRSHGGRVDSVRVRALSSGAAMAAWTYHEAILLNTGKRRQTRGAVLMTLVKRDSVWRITASKTTEVEAP